MAAQQNGDVPRGSAGDADLAQAFKDLARGEQTASALENHLDALEARIEELLAAADAQQQASAQGLASTSAEPSQGGASGSAVEKET
ncbi:hypothetical protein MPH_08175 [Macrophomina phaseolina MS6]|uniref:Uncharacterized protein n=1 Tax=Macrophomina phaseolina (strain MS6) TaxID=1126212 RepID=K2RPJ5_MACPH|nr:hypothetical protein MPH_08175 [Macrophomina phaseolina MS6]